MKHIFPFGIVILITFLFATCTPKIELNSRVTDISQLEWFVWLDKEAKWKNDSLCLPPVDITKIPVNIPTGGWKQLNEQKGKKITVPATVEEHFWGFNGSSYGITGNYTGVSWFYTSFVIPEKSKGKKILLDFESVRLRAEVFVNEQLTGYDIIGNTPFQVDITDVVKYGNMNKLAIRITDPSGNFTWRDYAPYKWGDQNIPPSHGFGGITGKVSIITLDKTYISDLFVKNKPSINEIDLQITINGDKQNGSGTLNYKIFDPEGNLVVDLISEEQIDSSCFITTKSVKIDHPHLWSVESPHLYKAYIKWNGTDGSSDSISKPFGLRWFHIAEERGDRQLYLNDKRIVLRTAISWGFWPVNGIYPTAELAERQTDLAKSLGLNMLNFHRAIGQPHLMDLADTKGLLIYEEPGGYGHYGNDSLTNEWNRIKLMRMIKRDRSHPSLIIYDMVNEAGRDPRPNELRDIADAHKLDETRVITFSSQYYPDHYHRGKAPFDPAIGKAYMEPYNHEIKTQGWWDEHHAGGTGTYTDDKYNAKNDYYLYTNHKSEVIFWGEENAIGTPARIELVNLEIAKNELNGWDSDDFQLMYNGYYSFMEKFGFLDAFGSVDALTRSLGNVSLYNQGRIIENIRINNITDGYAINGWEEFKFENHSGIVDIYRNLKGDVETLSYYNKPAYIAIKADHTVFELHDSTYIDIYIVNETNIQGDFILDVEYYQNNEIFEKRSIPVFVSGGNIYGELLAERLIISPHHHGYVDIKAKLTKNKDAVAEGMEKLFVVELQNLWKQKIAIYDQDSALQNTLTRCGVHNLIKYESVDESPAEKILIAGSYPEYYKDYMDPVAKPFVEWLMDGGTMIVLTNTDKWAHYLMRKEIANYRGDQEGWIHWYGGNFFVREHPLFEGLPVNTAFNWEYHSLANYDRQRYGLRLENGECVAGFQADHKQELFSAVSIIPVGRGKVILSTLDIQGAVNEDDKASVMAKRIVQNYIKFAGSY